MKHCRALESGPLGCHWRIFNKGKSCRLISPGSSHLEPVAVRIHHRQHRFTHIREGKTLFLPHCQSLGDLSPLADEGAPLPTTHCPPCGYVMERMEQSFPPVPEPSPGAPTPAPLMNLPEKPCDPALLFDPPVIHAR